MPPSLGRGRVVPPPPPPVGGAHFRVIAPAGNTAPFKEMLLRWRVFGNTVSNLTGPRFAPQTSPSRDERVTARSTGWSVQYSKIDFTSCNELLFNRRKW